LGNTYHNIAVKGPTQDHIVAHLDAQKQAAFVSPTLTDLTFVYGPDEEWSALAEDLSRTFQCPALFVSVYDGDVLQYILYAEGRPIDEYNSAPDYFDGEEWGGEGEAEETSSHQPEPAGGNAHLLCSTLGVGQATAQVEAILHPPDEGVIRASGMDAFGQHWALAESLGWPPQACTTDYRRLELDGDEVAEDLKAVFADAPLIETPR